MERLRLTFLQVLGVLLLTAVAACTESGLHPSAMSEMTFGASYAPENARTVLSESVKILWEDGDGIYVSGAEEPFVTTLSEPSASYGKERSWALLGFLS